MSPPTFKSIVHLRLQETSKNNIHGLFWTTFQTPICLPSRTISQYIPNLHHRRLNATKNMNIDPNRIRQQTLHDRLCCIIFISCASFANTEKLVFPSMSMLGSGFACHCQMRRFCIRLVTCTRLTCCPNQEDNLVLYQQYCASLIILECRLLQEISRFGVTQTLLVLSGRFLSTLVALHQRGGVVAALKQQCLQLFRMHSYCSVDIIRGSFWIFLYNMAYAVS
jgi:hypothetical protein